MAKNCSACEDLREYASEFALNGVTSTVDASLRNDTGFNPNNARTDCADLNDAMDCLVGNMEDEIDAYDVCDWKEFMRKFVPNVYQTGKAIGSAICGLWTNVHNLWAKVNRHDCLINGLLNVKEINFDADDFTTGTDVTLRSNSTSIGVTLDIVNGEAILNASVSFKDGSKWRTVTPNTDDGNWLILELRIKKSDYGIKHIYATDSQSINNGTYLASFYGFDGDRDYETYGRASRGIYSNRTPKQWGWSDGYNTVPKGWIYLQLRCSSILATQKDVSFFAQTPVVLDETSMGC